MSSISVQMEDAKLNALRFQMEKKGMNPDQEIQNLIGPTLQKFYEKQVPREVREFAEAMSAMQTERQAPAPARGRNGNGDKPKTPKEIIGQEAFTGAR